MRAALFLVLALAATACPNKAAPTTGPDNTGGGGDPANLDERQACTDDVQCSAVEVECCDACNGGMVVGVHSDFAADVITTYVPLGSCAETMCTEMACERPKAACQQGACGIVRPDGSIEHVALPPVP